MSELPTNILKKISYPLSKHDRFLASDISLIVREVSYTHAICQQAKRGFRSLNSLLQQFTSVSSKKGGKVIRSCFLDIKLLFPIRAWKVTKMEMNYIWSASVNDCKAFFSKGNVNDR